MSKAFPGFTISIHALPAEGDRTTPRRTFGQTISIHALPAEGDLPAKYQVAPALSISIHALPAEGDLGQPRIVRPAA